MLVHPASTGMRTDGVGAAAEEREAHYKALLAQQKRQAEEVAQALAEQEARQAAERERLLRNAAATSSADPMSTQRVSAWIGPTRVIHRLERLIHDDEEYRVDHADDAYAYEQRHDSAYSTDLEESEESELWAEDDGRERYASASATGPSSAKTQMVDFDKVIDVGTMLRVPGAAATAAATTAAAAAPQLAWPPDRRPQTAPHSQTQRPGRRPATVNASQPRRLQGARRRLAQEHVALSELKAEVEQLLVDAQSITQAARRSSDEGRAPTATVNAREISTQTPGRPQLGGPTSTDHLRASGTGAGAAGAARAAGAAASTAAGAAAPSQASSANSVARAPALPARLPPLEPLRTLPIPQTLALPPLDQAPPPQAPPRLVPLSLQQIIREETAALQSEAVEFSPGGGTLRIPDLPPAQLTTASAVAATAAPNPAQLVAPARQMEPSLETGLRMDSEGFGAETVALAVAVEAAAPTELEQAAIGVEPASGRPAAAEVAAAPAAASPARSSSSSSSTVVTQSQAEEEPTIIVVDGPLSSAKAGLLQKLRDLLPAPCLLISTKTFTDLLPETVRRGGGGGGGGGGDVAVDDANAEWLARCRAGMCDSLRAMASSGNHLLIDFDWGGDLGLLRSLCAALRSFQCALFINAGGDEGQGASGNSGGGLVVYDFDMGTLVGMDEGTQMDVLDAVVLAHLESRRMPATIHSPVRRSAAEQAAAAAAGEEENEEEEEEEARQTALVATLERLDGRQRGASDGAAASNARTG
jgi:hypothetical protein